MKIIFLDVDGVLNCQNSKSNCYGIMGIDDDKVIRLRKIVECTDAKIVLISTWKTNWQKLHKDEQGYMADYLDRKLKRQRLAIMDKTDDYIAMRGEGIDQWLKGRNVESFVILDDEEFDYAKTGIIDRLIKTEFYNDNGGLQEEHIQIAINKLNGVKKWRIRK